ncbi:hypothetical protein C1645_700041, partial [Glomus cerebriforme]
LYCLIPGERVNNIFEVRISNANNNQVSSLAKAIRNCHPDLFKDIDSSKLILYMNKAKADSVIILNLKNNNVAILKGTELMGLEITILSYFNGQPIPKFQGEKGINVIIYPPTDN